MEAVRKLGIFPVNSPGNSVASWSLHCKRLFVTWQIQKFNNEELRYYVWPVAESTAKKRPFLPHVLIDCDLWIFEIS